MKDKDKEYKRPLDPKLDSSSLLLDLNLILLINSFYRKYKRRRYYTLLLN